MCDNGQEFVQWFDMVDVGLGGFVYMWRYFLGVFMGGYV